VSTDKKRAIERDKERLEAEKAKNTKPKKEKKKKKAAKASTDVNSILPYLRVLKNDIWLIAEDTYSKAYVFDDINYNLGDFSNKVAYLQNYCNFLNTLDNTIDCQISMYNRRINIKDFEADLLIKEQYDEFEEFRTEYNERVLKNAMMKGQNAIKKLLCVTLTVKAPSEEIAVNKFKTLDLSTKQSFTRIGTANLRVMTSKERVELLRDIFRDPTDLVPDFTDEDYANGLEKNFCAPDDFLFRDSYFVFEDTYATILYIKDYPSNANDYILTDLLRTNLKILVTMNMLAHDPVKAKKLVQSQITSIDTNLIQREAKAAQRGVFLKPPKKIQEYKQGLEDLYHKISADDQKLFSVNTLIMVTGYDYKELMQNCDIVADTLKRDSSLEGRMKYQQKDGIKDVIPCGSHRAFQFRRTLNTEPVAAIHPFNAKEVQQPNGIYYGLNSLSNNVITFNKYTLKNPNGFILGCPGAGKSFTAKREIMDVFMRYPEADVMIIDPEREYGALVDMFGGSFVKISTGSKNYINPFEFDIALLDAEIEDEHIDVLADKANLITGFISAMDVKNPLTAQENSFIDRCVRKSYEKFMDTYDNKYMPTLEVLYNVMKEQTDVNPKMREKLLMTLEMYVSGSANYFNNPTNIDVENRMIAYDIKDLNGVMKTQSMLLILDYIWNRLSKNRESGRMTWIYVDEIYLLFADEYCLNFLKALYKRARKYGGVITGITQNVEDLLRNDDCRTMLSNSECVILLKQSPADLEKLKKTMSLSNEEQSHVRNVPAGRGLMVLGGGDKVPFYDEFPKDTELYRRISTSFSEILAAKGKSA
jgi:hypothetical protein